MQEQLDLLADKLGLVATYIIVFIGVLKLIRWTFRSLVYIKKNLFTWKLDLFARYDAKDSWAVVTGGSDGIGQEMARRFARQGFNVVLIARTMSKLEATSQDLKRINPKIKVKIIQTDFIGNTNLPYYKELFAQISKLEIAAVFINAGVMPVGNFINLPPDVVQGMIDVNVYHFIMFYKYFIHNFLERSKSGKRSLLLGTASVIGRRQISPFVSYAGTKATALYTAEVIKFELAHMGRQSDGSDPSLVDCYLSTPMGVNTNLLEGDYKEHVWSRYNFQTPAYVNALERNIGQHYRTYGNLAMELQATLGFTMACKYMPFAVEASVGWLGSFIAGYDHRASRDEYHKWYFYNCGQEKCWVENCPRVKN